MQHRKEIFCVKNKKIMAITMATVLGVSAFGGTNVSIADAAKKGSMKKVVSYYKQGKITKARNEAKKLPKTVGYGLTCPGFLGDYGEEYLDAIDSKSNVQAIYLADYDQDAYSELFIMSGACEADMMLDCYDVYYDDYTDDFYGEVRRSWSVNASHATIHAYPETHSIILMSGIQGYEQMVIVNSKGKVKRYSRDLGMKGSYFNPRNKLKKVKRSYIEKKSKEKLWD